MAEVKEGFETTNAVDPSAEIAAHTPTPWFYRAKIFNNGENTDALGSIRGPASDNDPWFIATVEHMPGAEANAAFIVRAVNAHEDLVAALRLACTQAVRDANWDKPPQSKWYYAAKAALAKATSTGK